MTIETETSTAELLQELAAKGINMTISPERPDRLRYSPKAAMTDELIARLKSHKANLLILLHESEEPQAVTPPTTGSEPTVPELANPYSQTMCRDCGDSDARLQNVFAVGTGWPFKLCWECYAQRYGVYPNRSALGRPAMLEEAKRNHLSVWTADNGRLLKVSGPQESKALAHRLLSNAGAIREAIKFYPDAEMIVSLPDGVDTVFELTGLVREGEK